MSTTSKVLSLILILLVSLSFSAGISSAEGDPLSVVFVNDGHTNPYHVEWLAGFEDALEAYNKEFGGIEGYWLSASNLGEEIEKVEGAIEKEPDIMFVNAIDVDALKPLADEAQAKGIIWISVHNYMDTADYNFMLGDVENGYNQGLALATYFGGKAKVAVMLGSGNTSGEARREGILKALGEFPDVEVVSEKRADWDTVKAQKVAVEWFSEFPDLNALSVVTDSYLYPATQIAEDFELEDIAYFGYDGDKAILKQIKDPGKIKADILLSATREGWNFVQMAYKISKGMPVEKDYNFYTPLVLTEETHKICLENGFPEDIEVMYVDQALEIAEKGYLEFGPDSVK